MALFDKLREPVFLKGNSSMSSQIETLQNLLPKLNYSGQQIATQDIKLLEYGLAGEKNIAFELKNSHLPMYVLHDLYLEQNGLTAQIDYLVVTRKLIFVIECKNLFGNIEITSNGDFIRSIPIGSKTVKEGIYSPITQNQRHLELLSSIKREKLNSSVMKFLYDKICTNMYKSIVVLANPKTILNTKYAKKEVKEKVIRADQLIMYIKNEISKCKDPESSDADMLNWAESFMKLHVNRIEDYTKKYSSYVNNTPVLETESNNNVDANTFIEEAELFKALKGFRLSKSREEKVKAFYIFSDNQLNDLISKRPQNKDELLGISGFGPVKVERYGDEILSILHLGGACN